MRDQAVSVAEASQAEVAEAKRAAALQKLKDAKYARVMEYNNKLIEEKAKAQADDLSKESTEVKKQKAELKQGEKKLTEDRKVMVEKVKSELQIKFDIHESK